MPKSPISPISPVSRLTKKQRGRLEELILERQRRDKLELAERLRNDFAAFVRAAWSVVDPAMPLIDNWHIDAMAVHLQAVAEGRIRYLMISVGPGYAKSIIASVMFSAWIWARNPQVKISAATYSKSLTIRDSLRVRDLLSSTWFRETFGPGWKWVKENEDWLSNDQKGERRAFTVGGAATGFRADGQIFDDLLNATDRHSEAARSAAQDWAIRTMSTRFNDMRKGWRVVIGQRLHEEDPYGAMLATGDYVHLNLPSEFERERKCCAWCKVHGATTKIGFTDPRKEDGELLFPELFTAAVIAQAKKDLGSYDYAGQHQQRPAPAEGGMFKRSYWRRYTREELPGIDVFIISVDCNFKEASDNDYVAIHVYGFVGPRCYLLARRHEQMGFRATLQSIRVLWDEFRPAATLIEDKANGPAVIEELSREIPGVIAINPEGGKIARAWAAQPTVEAGGVFLPVEGIIAGQNGIDGADEVIEETAAFPNGRHDDDVDAMTQALNWHRTNNDLSTWARLGAGS